jgi:predicted AAA+ superfamily ATPase
MPLIPREIAETLQTLTPPKAVVLLGARQVGKTTLFKEIVRDPNALWLTGDSPQSVRLLQSAHQEGNLADLLLQTRTLVIDEAQRIPNIGIILKTLVDADSGAQIFVTGSSSLDLAGGVRESAAGRLITRELWPVSAKELAQSKGWARVLLDINSRLLFGMYPAVIESSEPRLLLENYCSDVLFKDIFALSGIRHPQKLTNLVTYLAAQVGSEVNYDSLSREVGLSKQTVMDYIDLLEQSFIIRRCDSFSGNLPNELKKGKKIYFCDNGIRNALLGDFSPIETRRDKGALWENFFFMELVKKHSYDGRFVREAFWRAQKQGGHVQAEVDFVEVFNNRLTAAFECKFASEEKTRSVRNFSKHYPDCPVRLVTPGNFYKFLTEENTAQPAGA